MKDKHEEVLLVIGKCFNNSMLNEKEIELIEKTSFNDFIFIYGLNMDQIDKIKNCVKLCKNRIVY